MIDLYTFTTPNGRKASIMLEEVELSYNVHIIDISKNMGIGHWALGMGHGRGQTSTLTVNCSLFPVPCSRFPTRDLLTANC